MNKPDETWEDEIDAMEENHEIETSTEAKFWKGYIGKIIAAELKRERQRIREEVNLLNTVDQDVSWTDAVWKDDVLAILEEIEGMK